VLLDVELPDQNGFDIARELRAMSNTKRIGIIMVTAHDNHGMHQCGWAEVALL
jgi:DNA-binding response OmpR family regulator